MRRRRASRRLRGRAVERYYRYLMWYIETLPSRWGAEDFALQADEMDARWPEESFAVALMRPGDGCAVDESLWLPPAAGEFINKNPPGGAGRVF